MKFGPSRGNPLIIFDHFLKNFGLLILLIGYALIKGPEIFIENIGFVVVVLITPIASFIKYFFTYFTVDEEKMIIQSGLFIKKTMEIPLQGITTVDLSQSLLFQIFGVYKIKADNSSQTNDNEKQAEIELALKKEAAFRVKELLESKSVLKMAEKNETNSDYEHNENNENMEIHKVESNGILNGKDEKEQAASILCPMFDFFLLGAMQSKILYILAMITTLFGGVGYFSSLDFVEEGSAFLIHQLFQVMSPVIGVSLLLFVSYFGSMIFSATVTTIKYYGYRITKRKDALSITFGLFTKKSYTLMLEKISGVVIKQSLLMRIFGYCTVEVLIIGYGDNKENQEQEMSILYPMTKLDKADEVLGKLLPEMYFNRNYKKAELRTLPYFFLTPRLFLVAGLFLGAIITAKIMAEPLILTISMAAGLFLLVVTFVSIFMEYRISGMNGDSNIISVCAGIFEKRMTFIKTEKIESIEKTGSIWKQKIGYGTLKLGYVAPLRTSHLKAKNVRVESFYELQKNLTF